jgi:hypothetical protein
LLCSTLLDIREYASFGTLLVFLRSAGFNLSHLAFPAVVLTFDVEDLVWLQLLLVKSVFLGDFST